MRYCSVTRNVTYIMPFISHHSLRNPCILHAIACDLLTINNFVTFYGTITKPPVSTENRSVDHERNGQSLRVAALNCHAARADYR